MSIFFVSLVGLLPGCGEVSGETHQIRLVFRSSDVWEERECDVGHP